jgi:hypothetical protein
MIELCKLTLKKSLSEPMDDWPDDNRASIWDDFLDLCLHNVEF